MLQNYFEPLELGWSARVVQQESTSAGCSKRPSSKAAGESKPEAYPRGHVEDFDEPRTKLADFFSILLTLIWLLFHLLLLDQTGQVRALEFEAVCCFCLIALRFFDCLLDDVAAMFFHRLMVRE
jgi:hypothetical protein